MRRFEISIFEKVFHVEYHSHDEWWADDDHGNEPSYREYKILEEKLTDRLVGEAEAACEAAMEMQAEAQDE